MGKVGFQASVNRELRKVDGRGREMEFHNQSKQRSGHLLLPKEKQRGVHAEEGTL